MAKASWKACSISGDHTPSASLPISSASPCKGEAESYMVTTDTHINSIRCKIDNLKLQWW